MDNSVTDLMDEMIKAIFGSSRAYLNAYRTADRIGKYINGAVESSLVSASELVNINILTYDELTTYYEMIIDSFKKSFQIYIYESDPDVIGWSTHIHKMKVYDQHYISSQSWDKLIDTLYHLEDKFKVPLVGMLSL